MYVVRSTSSDPLILMVRISETAIQRCNAMNNRWQRVRDAASNRLDRQPVTIFPSSFTLFINRLHHIRLCCNVQLSCCQCIIQAIDIVCIGVLNKTAYLLLSNVDVNLFNSRLTFNNCPQQEPVTNVVCFFHYCAVFNINKYRGHTDNCSKIIFNECYSHMIRSPNVLWWINLKCYNSTCVH